MVDGGAVQIDKYFTVEIMDFSDDLNLFDRTTHTGWVRCHGARQGIDNTDHESFIKGTQKLLGVGLRWVGSQRRI